MYVSMGKQIDKNIFQYCDPIALSHGGYFDVLIILIMAVFHLVPVAGPF